MTLLQEAQYGLMIYLGLNPLVWILLKFEVVRKFVRNYKIFHPNSISWGRIYISIPLHAVAFWFCFDKNYQVHPEMFSYLLLVYVALFASDGTDGIVARACDLVSDEGAILDAKADEITDLPLFWIFVLTGIVGNTPFCALIATLAVIFMTQADIIGQCCRGMSGHPAAKLIGKSKTVFKMLTIIYIAQYMKHADFSIIIWDIPVYIFSDYLAIGMVSLSSIFALLSMESKLPFRTWIDEKNFF